MHFTVHVTNDGRIQPGRKKKLFSLQSCSQDVLGNKVKGAQDVSIRSWSSRNRDSDPDGFLCTQEEKAREQGRQGASLAPATWNSDRGNGDRDPMQASLEIRGALAPQYMERQSGAGKNLAELLRRDRRVATPGNQAGVYISLADLG